MNLSVIIVSWNTAELTLRCLGSLYQALPEELTSEVLVVDNGSDDGSPEAIARSFPDVTLIRRRENAGFACANNEALRLARGEHLFLLNSDAMPLPGSVARLLAHLRENSRCGLVGPRLLNGDGTLQPSCWRFPRWDTTALEALYLYRLMPRRAHGERLLGGYWDHSHGRPVDWVMGAAMLVRREVVTEAGGLDEGSFMYGEDLEWCWRIRRCGWQIDYEPAAEVVHLGGQSALRRYRGTEGRAKHEAYYRFCRRHLGVAHTTTLRLINAAGALLRWGAFSAQRALRPTPAHRAAVRVYREALGAHVGAAGDDRRPTTDERPPREGRRTTGSTA